MVEPHKGLLKLDYIQYLVRNPQLYASSRTFRNFQNSKRMHLFKNWPECKNLGTLNHCLNCGVSHSERNPITTDHMIPQVLIKYQDPLRERLKREVVTSPKNRFSVCQRCHSEIDRFKIQRLGVTLPQDPVAMIDFLKDDYPITRGRNRFNMLRAVQEVVDKYIDVIQGFKIPNNTSPINPDDLQPFSDSLPVAYQFSGTLFRQIIALQSELDAECADLVQSHSQRI